MGIKDPNNIIKFDVIRFKNGYAKNAREITIESNGIVVGYPISGLAEECWLDKEVFVIKLGKILETKNIN